MKLGDKIFIEAAKGELHIKKIYSVREALNMPKIAQGSPEEIENELEKEGQKQEKLV